MNDYYVYTHSDFDYNVFYVGKGRGNRKSDFRRRSKKWKEYTKDKKFVVDIVYDNLTEEEALDAEAALIELHGIDNLVNIKHPTPKHNTVWFDLIQKAKDVKTLLELPEDAYKDKFIREQIDLIQFCEKLQKEIDLLK